MGTAKIAELPNNPPSTSDKSVVGSSVASDTSMWEEDAADGTIDDEIDLVVLSARVMRSTGRACRGDTTCCNDDAEDTAEGGTTNANDDGRSDATKKLTTRTRVVVRDDEDGIMIR
jgi:hypothetical protein